MAPTSNRRPKAADVAARWSPVSHRPGCPVQASMLVSMVHQVDWRRRERQSFPSTTCRAWQSFAVAIGRRNCDPTPRSGHAQDPTLLLVISWPARSPESGEDAPSRAGNAVPTSPTGAAVWISFLLAGAIAGLQGYSFAKFGACYPPLAGCSSTSSAATATATSRASSRGCCWLRRDHHGDGCRLFGSYASAAVADQSAVWTKVFAVAVLVVMTVLNILGSHAVARAQTDVVTDVGILTLVRGRDPGDPRPRAARVLGVPAAAGDRVQRGPRWRRGSSSHGAQRSGG